MMQKVVMRDERTGETVERYVDRGPSSAVPGHGRKLAVAGGGGYQRGSKGPPPAEGYVRRSAR